MMCPCGLKKRYEACCGIYLEGKASAPTPETLMRSRYTAYTKGDFDYIEKTMLGDALAAFNRVQAEAEAGKTQFLNLQLLSSEAEGEEGVVEFIVFFRFQGNEQMMHERSTFRKISDQWYYSRGEVH